MISLSTPQPLADAVAHLSAKTPVGAVLTSAEWADMQLALRQRAQFSATVESARLLSAFQEKLEMHLRQYREQVAHGTALVDRSVFIADMRKLAREFGLGPAAPEHAGTVRDITSAARLGMIFDIQTGMARGYAGWKMDQDADVLDASPAQELVRKARRKVQRDWRARWIAAGGRLVDGRMVALKTDDVWRKISRFGVPWPPFDFQSGMGLDSLGRAEAEDLGLLAQDERLEPVEEGFNDHLKASVSGMQPAILARLFARLKELFGDQIELADGELRWKANGASAIRNSVWNPATHPRGRGGMFAAEKGGGFGSGSKHPAIGKQGDAKSLGLPAAADLPAFTPRPKRISPEEALAALPLSAEAPNGISVDFGKRIQDHLEEHLETGRASWLLHAVETVEHSAEIWRNGNRLNHIGVFGAASGNKQFLVVTHQIGETKATVVTFHPKNLRELEKERRGTLLDTSYPENITQSGQSHT